MEKLNKRKIWEVKEKREKIKKEKRKAKGKTNSEKKRRHPRYIMDIVIHSLS